MKHFIEKVSGTLEKDPNFRALCVAGSYISGNIDSFSDNDLVILTSPEFIINQENMLSVAN